MRTPLALIHNEAAGDASRDRNWLVETLSRAGYEVRYHRHDAAGVAAALDGGAELIAVAGGDGTVANVAAQARPNGPPIAILPLGTANDIAASLGLRAISRSLWPGGAAVRCCRSIRSTRKAMGKPPLDQRAWLRRDRGGDRRSAGCNRPRRGRRAYAER